MWSTHCDSVVAFGSAFGIEDRGAGMLLQQSDDSEHVSLLRGFQINLYHCLTALYCPCLS